LTATTELTSRYRGHSFCVAALLAGALLLASCAPGAAPTIESMATPAVSSATITSAPAMVTRVPDTTQPAGAPATPATDTAVGVAAIQRLFDNQALHPVLHGVAALINSPNGDRPATYFDDDQLRYWVDLATGQVVEVDPKAQQPDWIRPALPEAELRARAEQFILRATPGFASQQAQLAYQAGTKDGVLYFYRWEDHQAKGWISQPPLAQVGVTISGRVVSYLNTLFLANSLSPAGPTGMPAATVPVMPSAVAPAPLGTIEASEPVNLRAGPSTEYDVVGQLAAGRRYRVVGQAGDWWVITLEDAQTAWVFMDLVVFTPDNQAATPTVTAQALFASGPSASAPIRAGRFLLAASNSTAICRVRALDASGAVLAENRLNWPGPKMTAGACP
jgi:SH3-like domain-containing protein